MPRVYLGGDFLMSAPSLEAPQVTGQKQGTALKRPSGSRQEDLRSAGSFLFTTQILLQIPGWRDLRAGSPAFESEPCRVLAV